MPLVLAALAGRGGCAVEDDVGVEMDRTSGTEPQCEQRNQAEHGEKA